MASTNEVLSRGPDETVRVLNADGTVVAPELLPDLDDETFVSMFRDMLFCRRFDERMISLQRQGRIGTYSSLAGQEGSQIGSTYALDPEDLVSYQYREHGAVVARGFPWEYLLYWAGREEGHEALADRNVFPLNIAIADHLPHAVGAAMAMKHREEERVAVAHFGDGATSEGDFHEGLNFAGVFDTPNVFFCNNNQWAISVPRERQTAAATIAQKATAYGFEGVQVDGMDPLAVYAATRAAVEKAKNPGEGERRPTLIEAVQYRFGAHTTADDPSVYRNSDEVEQWKRKDPIPRLEKFLRNTGRLNDEKIASIQESVEDEVAEAIKAAESEPRPEPSEMFSNVFAEQTPEIRVQAEAFAEMYERHGDEGFLRE